jgi:hypothetical protein
MKITQHTETYLELQSRDYYTAKIASIFGVSFLVFGLLLHASGVSFAFIFITGGLILIFGGISANFEMNCHFDRELNLFKLSYRNLIRHKKIERFLSDIKDVRLAQDTDVDGYIFYWLVVMMKSGEEISISYLLRTSGNLETYELMVTDVRSFIHDTI